MLDLAEGLLKHRGGRGQSTLCCHVSVQMCCSVSRVFQRVNDLPPTGEVDEPTLDVMRQPRCGMEDPFNKRQHRYRVLGETSLGL